MTIGMLGIVLFFTISGVINIYLSRMVGLLYITARDTYLKFWMAGIFAFSLVLFLPGLVLYVIDFFGLRPGTMAASEGLSAEASE
jgi:hypothetical protein